MSAGNMHHPILNFKDTDKGIEMGESLRHPALCPMYKESPCRMFFNPSAMEDFGEDG